MTPTEHDLREGDVVTLDNGACFLLQKSIYGVGYSFRSTCKSSNPLDLPGVKVGDTVFLKAPQLRTADRVVDSRAPGATLNAVRRRFQAEFEKKALLDELAGSAADGDLRDRCVARMIAHQNIDRVRSAAGPERQLHDPLPVLIHEYVPGRLLSKPLSHDPGHVPPPTFEAWKALATELCTIVRRVHNQGILHGGILPRNFVEVVHEATKRAHYVLVGFGYAALCDTAPILSPDVEKDDEAYRAPERRARSVATHERGALSDLLPDSPSLGALWIPSDIYSLGMVLLYCAVGKAGRSLEVPPSNVDDLKEFVSNELRLYNSQLLTENENVTRVIDKCLRSDPDNRFSCVEEVLDAISDISTPDSHSLEPPPDNTPASPIVGALRDLKSSLRGAIAPDFFSSIGIRHIDELEKHVERMSRGHFELYGHRDMLVSSLCKFLVSIRPGDEYSTMTLPAYWTDANLGANGRFLTMNKHIARRGVLIRRLFLVSGEFFSLPAEERRVLERQRDALEDWKDTRGMKGNFEVKVQVRPQEEIERFETGAGFVAYIEPDPLQASSAQRPHICLNFVSHGDRDQVYGRSRIVRQIKKIRFWSVGRAENSNRRKRFERSKASFDIAWEAADSLEDYMHGPTRTLDLASLFARIEAQELQADPAEASWQALNVALSVRRGD
jgi:hypothetical protein